MLLPLLLWLGTIAAASAAPVHKPNDLPCLTNVAQIRALSSEQAQRGYPVRLKALVTFHNHYRLCFVQDDTGAIFVLRHKGATPLRGGQLVLINGITGGGDYAPIVLEDKFELLGTAPVPEPEPLSFDNLNSGQADCQWVEIRGIVRFVKPILDSHLHLELACGGGRLRCYLFGYPQKDCQRLVDSTVRLRGVAGSIFNTRHQFVAPLLFAIGTTNLVIEQQPASEPYDMPVRRVESLLQYSPNASFGHRVKISGIVTFQEPGKAVFIRDGPRGARIDTLITNSLQPGDIIEAVGFPDMGRYSPALEDAMFRCVSHGPTPAPVIINPEKLLAGNADADLVSVQARLLDLVRRGGEWILVLQTQDTIFNAHLSQTNASLAHLRRGSLLRVSGICLIQEAKERVSILTPQSFQILLRTAADIAVLQQPSWWTLQRTLWLLGIMGAVLLAGVAWVLVLNRRVRNQTRIIQQKIQREAVLEERTRIAREFHDTLEQELAAINIQLNTVSSQFDDSPQTAREQLELARNISRRSLSEARRSVWDLRSHLLENSDLVTAIAEMAKPLMAGNNTLFHVATSGQSRRLAATLENNLLRIAQEALANALKHAAPKNIVAELRYSPDTVQLRISDDGHGFTPHQHLSLGGGHFGLLDMRERAEKCGGSLVLNSAPGSGTEIIAQIPDKPSNGDRNAACPQPPPPSNAQ